MFGAIKKKAPPSRKSSFESDLTTSCALAGWTRDLVPAPEHLETPERFGTTQASISMQCDNV